MFRIIRNMSLIGWWTPRYDTPVAPLGLGYVWIRFSIHLSPRWGFVDRRSPRGSRDRGCPTYGEGILLGFTVPRSTQPTCYGGHFGWFRTLTIDGRRVTACITHKKSRSTRRLWSGDGQIKSQGYRIARTAAQQSHGMEPNFVPSNRYCK